MTRTKNETHCGYRNYETFSVAVVVDNDQDLYHRARDIANGATISADIEGRDRDCAAADAVKAWLEALWIDPVTEDGPASGTPASTLLLAAWSEVDWLEIVREYAADIDTDA
jgi:hypothetical protein